MKFGGHLGGLGQQALTRTPQIPSKVLPAPSSCSFGPIQQQHRQSLQQAQGPARFPLRAAAVDTPADSSAGNKPATERGTRSSDNAEDYEIIGRSSSTSRSEQSDENPVPSFSGRRSTFADRQFERSPRGGGRGSGSSGRGQGSAGYSSNYSDSRSAFGGRSDGPSRAGRGAGGGHYERRDMPQGGYGKPAGEEGKSDERARGQGRDRDSSRSFRQRDEQGRGGAAGQEREFQQADRLQNQAADAGTMFDAIRRERRGYNEQRADGTISAPAGGNTFADGVAGRAAGSCSASDGAGDMQDAGSDGVEGSSSRSSSGKPPKLVLPIVRPEEGDKGTFFSPASFKELGVSAGMIEALQVMGIHRPSHVQAQALEAFRNAEALHLVLADQAGSGKTLAYLLPLIQALKAEEKRAGQAITEPCKPSVVIVAPTTELVQQVTRVCKALSLAGARFKSTAMTGGQPEEHERSKVLRTQREMLKQGVDVVIATPGRLQELLAREYLSLAKCRAVVLDEVDVLLGGQDEGNASSFSEQIAPLREAAPDGMRFILVTATLAQHVFASLTTAFPDMATAFGPGLHRTAAGLTEELLDCSGGEDISLESGTARKLDALRGALGVHGAARVLVFCNKIQSCREVENFLSRSDKGQARYRVVAYHEAIRPQIRQAALEAFLSPVTPGEPPMVLVCTDRTSRGIDSMFCEHVVLFDFPRDPSEYVRRVGRTARGAGGRGVVTVLVLGQQVKLAKDIMARTEKGMPIHRIPQAPNAW